MNGVKSIQNGVKNIDLAPGIVNLESGERFMNYKGYKDLECYIQSRLLRIFVCGLIKKFPAYEKFLLTAQILDSSRSVSTNIAEGYGRFTYADTRNFFIISRGSTIETMEHLTIACDENYITAEELKTGEEKCELVFKLINGYIKYLEKSKNEIKKHHEPNS
jgi:four helix bundle protein